MWREGCPGNQGQTPPPVYVVGLLASPGPQGWPLIGAHSLPPHVSPAYGVPSVWKAEKQQ
jgi:hypothetical protein